jgi:ribosomal protein S12 methylthiotransferase accessory factor
MNAFEVTFPGGVRVDATFRGNTVHTDQPAPYGENTAMAPFDLFMASIATCAGYYALRFCQERSISIEGMGLSLDFERDPEKKRISKVRITLTTPAGFPEKYEAAIVRAMDQCAVKKAIVDPPEFDLVVASVGTATT